MNFGFNNTRNTYIYSTRDVVESLKNNNLNISTDVISKYLRDNDFEGKKLAIKNTEIVPFLNEPHEVWRISLYGTNEIIKYFLDKRREEEKELKEGHTIKEIVKLYGEDYKKCNDSQICIFMQQENFEQRGLAKKTKYNCNGPQRWVVTQEGVDELLKKLFVKKGQQTIFNDDTKYIYNVKEIKEKLKDRYYIPDNTKISRLMNNLELAGWSKKMPKPSNGDFNPNKKGHYIWLVSEEGLKEFKRYCRQKTEYAIQQNNKKASNKKGQLIIEEVQDKQKPITHNENVYSIVLDNENAGFLHIISSSLNKNEIEVIKNVVEKFIDSKKEQIANIFLGAIDD